MTDQYDDILDDSEKFALQAFEENAIQREAVRKILLYPLYTNGTLRAGEHANATRNFAYNLYHAYHDKKDDELGSKFRAVCEGLTHVERAFEEIGKFRKVVDTEDNKNRAR